MLVISNGKVVTPEPLEMEEEEMQTQDRKVKETDKTVVHSRYMENVLGETDASLTTTE